MNHVELVPAAAAPGDPELRFLGWSQPALPAAAAVLANRYADGDAVDMRDAALVLPGARAGRRLVELLLDEAQSRGLRLVPPRVVGVGSLAERLYTPAAPLASGAVRRRAWARALRELARDRLARIFPEPPAAADLIAWQRLAATVERLHDEVAGAALRFQTVADHCRGDLLFADFERWTVLAEAQQAYEGILSDLGLADPGLARIQALDGGALAFDSDLWLVGVVEMPPVVHRMVEAFARGAPVHVLVHAPAEEADGFDRLGCIRPDRWTARSIPLRDEQIVIGDRPSDQADEIVRSLVQLDERYAAEEIVVGAPDPELLPYIEDRLIQAGVPVHSATGITVGRSAVARLLRACADYLDGGRFDALASLVRHPDVGRCLRETEGLQGADLLEALDRYFGACLPASVHGPFPSEPEVETASVEMLRQRLDDERLLGGLRGQRRISEWMDPVTRLTARVYAEIEADSARPADRRLLEACTRLRNAAVELAELPAALDEPCDAATALRLLLEAVHTQNLPPEPDRAAVEALGWLELRLDDTPVAIVTGFNEPALPESLNADPFLPNALRECIGVEDNAARYARDAYQLTAMCHAREELRMIAGRTTATGDPLRPSRLMFAVDGQALARRVRGFHADPEGPRRKVGPSAAAGAADGAGFRMPRDRVLRAPQPIESLSVTAFGAILRDPYRYALERILGLKPLDDRARELDGLRFGALAHKILEQFGRSDAVHATDAAVIRAELDVLLDRTAEGRLGARPLPAVRIQLEQLRARLHAFARWQAEWIRDGWRVVGTECTTPEGGVPFDVDGSPFGLTGRIDRVDHHPERAEWALWDYKTGDRGDSPETTHREGRGDAKNWRDLQLPLYRHIVPQVSDGTGRRPYDIGPADPIRLGYIALCGELEKVGAIEAEWTDEELAEADECARHVVRIVRANAFEFDESKRKDYSRDPLGVLVGVGYLESAAAGEDGEDES